MIKKVLQLHIIDDMIRENWMTGNESDERKQYQNEKERRGCLKHADVLEKHIEVRMCDKE